MSEFEKLKVATKYELLKQIRRKRFYGALAITVLVIFLTIGLYKGLDLPERIRQIAIGQMQRENIPAQMQENLLDQMGIRDSPELFAMFVTSIGALAILGAVFFAGDAISSEFEHKTGYILFPNPVKRITIVVGKYLACFIATAAVLLVAYMISIVALLAFYGTVPVGGMIGSLAIALMLACFMISMAFTFSSVLKGGMGATITTLLTYMVVFSVISMILSYAGYDLWFMPDRAGDAMSATYGVSFENVFGGMIGGGGMMTGMMQASQDPTLSFFVLLGWTIGLFGLSIWLANRKEMI